MKVTMKLNYQMVEEGMKAKDSAENCRYPVSSKSGQFAKGKPVVIRGRKATGPIGPAALPDGQAATRFVGAQAGKAEPVLRFSDEGR